MKSHNLQQGLALGEAWEKRLEKLLRLVYEDLRPASMDEQREGIDRVGELKGSGVVHRIEIKTDLRGQIDGWKARYPTTSVLNRGYRTFGVCVPLGEFGKVAIATSTEKYGA